MFQIEGVRPTYKTYKRSCTMSPLFKESALLAMCIAIAALIGTYILVLGEYNRYGLC